MKVTKKQFGVNAIWKVLEQFSAKGISMIISILLMQILDPEDYGLLAITTIFTNLSDILIDGGFSTELIRKEKVDDYDYSAVFSISSSMALFLYIILFFCAPFASQIYEEPQLTAVLRVIGLTFFIQSFTAVRNGIVNRNMQFKLLFYCNTAASIISGIIGIIAAKTGLGVWALVIQRLTQQTILTVLLFIKVKWKVRWKFDLGRIKQMLSFSIGVVGSSLLNYAGGSLYSAVIGKKYSLTDLGYYDKGAQLPTQLSLYTFGAMSNVLLPTLSASQSDLERVKHIVRRVVGMTSFLIMPLMAGLAMTSREVILILFKVKWLPSLAIMQYSCLYYLATPYMLINVQVFFALGHSEIRVKTEVIRLVLIVLSLLVFVIGLNCSINDLALVSALIAVIVAAITFIEVRKLIHYTVRELFTDCWKAALSTMIMFAILYLLNRFFTPSSVILSLAVKVIAGVVSYAVLSLILKTGEVNDFLDLIKRRGRNG